LSTEAQAARAFLARPLSDRPSVSYQRKFLEAYHPNVTHYLPRDLRQRLAALGGPGLPAGALGRPLRQRLLVDLAWDSARLDGGGYSRTDAERLIAGGDPPAGRPLHDTQVLLNHKAAVEFLLEPGQDIGVDSTTVRNLSALLTENLLGGPLDEGRLRPGAVVIPGTSYLPPAEAPVIAACFLRLLATAAQITDPFEQSFFLLVHLLYLQPGHRPPRRHHPLPPPEPGPGFVPRCSSRALHGGHARRLRAEPGGPVAGPLCVRL
jgi:hypothetical protein